MASSLRAVEPSAETFAATRPLLFAIAYRMLGSAMDAEDVVQEAWLRWQGAPTTEVRSPRAYLATTVTRLAINQLRSARAQREVYVGPWLPEPVLSEPAGDPSAPLELAESLSMAFLVLLERLSPLERAVFLLREVFELDYGEIASVVEKAEANCRQLFARARRRLGSPAGRFAGDPAAAARLVDGFTRAAEAGDLDGLLALLAEDITMWTDGGGRIRGAARKPVHGAAAVARFLLALMRDAVPGGTALRRAAINGQPGFIAFLDDRPLAAMAFDVRDGRIQTIYAVGNPDKLRALK